MSKAETTFWDNRFSHRSKRSSYSSGKRVTDETPKWVPYVIVFSLCLMLCITINYRAFSEMSTGNYENAELQKKIDKMASENIVLQEQIYGLKTDAGAIEREVKKFGLIRPESKISVQAK